LLCTIVFTMCANRSYVVCWGNDGSMRRAGFIP